MTTSGAWSVTTDGAWVAWLTLDLSGERVNKLSSSVMGELERKLQALAADEAIKAIVVQSGKADDFIAGADIGELALIRDVDDARQKSELGQNILAALTRMPVPTVALVHGNCLGGGLELALACDYRIVTDHAKTSLGVPEVGLGFVPGWGGTQRLPRLIGLPAALEMILTGRPVNARKAMRIGLADAIVKHPFRAEGTRQFIDRALAGGGRKAIEQRRRRCQARILRLLGATAPGRSLMYRRSLKEVLAKTKGNYPAPLKAIDLVRRTYRRLPLPEGLAHEADAFSTLACTSISRNLVWLFQASGRVKKGSGTGGAGGMGEGLRSVGVIGAGVMGSGIAAACAQAGLTVRLKDIDWKAVSRGMATAAAGCRKQVESRRMTEGQMNLLMHRIRPTVDFAGFAGLDLVVEAVAEDLSIKQRVLRDIEAASGAETVICTNTSSLSLADLAAVLKRPKNFIGLHFFNPVARMPLVEVIPTRRTAPAALAAAVELVKSMGKTPVVVGDCAGFLVNRILLPYLIESAWMVEEGVGVERLDGLLESFGMPMGPMALVDEVGLDVGHEVACVLERAYGERMHVPKGLGAVAGSGELLGRKNGRGFYVYQNGHKKPNARAEELVALGRQRDGIAVAELSDRTIVDRAILIMVNEAARCLDEGVVGSPEQLDIAMVMGTGFAPFRGGLLRYADEQGLGEIKNRLEELAQAHGGRFAPAPLIERLARNGGRFHRTSDG